MPTEYVPFPQWDRTMVSHRAQVWYCRRKSAWQLAAIIDGEEVTRAEYDAAASLLDRIQRYALASAREWEAENSSERYCNSATHAQREKLLDARRDRLQNELKRYGLRLVNYGLYPSIVNSNDTDLHLLYYFG